MARKLQEQYNDEVEPAHSNLRSAAFVQVSSSARAKRQMMYEQAQDRASAALRLSQQLNDMAYSGLTAKLHLNEAKRVATTKKHFYRMQLPPTLFKKCKMQSLKDMMSEAKNEIGGIAQLALCDSITAPDFLKRVKALVPFDDYCVAATTAIAKIEEVLEQAAETDNIILEHQRAARQKTMKEMGKEKKQTRSPKKSTKKLNPRLVERYKQEKLNPIFVPLMGQLMAERPRDIAEFIRRFVTTEPGLAVRPMSPSKEARQFVVQRVKGILIPLFSRLMEEKPADPKAFILQELQGQADPEIVN